MIGLNCFNSNESSLVFANENSAWAKSCVGKTSNNNKVCSECMKGLKSSAMRKKPNVFAMLTVTKPPEPPSKFKPFSLYPVQVRNALRKAAKDDSNLTLFDMGGHDGPLEMFLTTVPKRFGGGS